MTSIVKSAGEDNGDEGKVSYFVTGILDRLGSSTVDDLAAELLKMKINSKNVLQRVRMFIYRSCVRVCVCVCECASVSTWMCPDWVPV